MCNTDPDLIFDGLVRVWLNASGLEASWCAGIIGPGFWQDATGPLSVSHFQTRFRSSTDVPDNIVQNQPGSGLVLADCIRFWPNGSGPEASRCARIIRPASGQRFHPDSDRMRMGSGMFTGYAFRLLKLGDRLICASLSRNLSVWSLFSRGRQLRRLLRAQPSPDHQQGLAGAVADVLVSGRPTARNL